SLQRRVRRHAIPPRRALPMVLIGAGQGGSLGPLTASGIAGVAPEDAGVASGRVNVAHQLGGSLELFVTVFAAAGAGTVDLSRKRASVNLVRRPWRTRGVNLPTGPGERFGRLSRGAEVRSRSPVVAAQGLDAVGRSGSG